MLVSLLDPEQHNRRRRFMKFISNAFSLFIIIALAAMWIHSQPTQQASTDLSENDLYCLVQNVYHEARGEGALGQAAVAHVTLNRVPSSAYPNSVCGVVWHEGQFSWTQNGKSDRMTDEDAIGKAVDIALAVSRDRIKDPTGGALHYYAHDRVKPHWSRAGYQLIVGDHTFVRMAKR
jgi:N-acetylmuramoyl-L-alanine amidase